MIIKCVNEKHRFPLTLGYIYPTVSYKYNKKDKKLEEFLIMDDDDSLCWYEIKDVIVESLENKKYTIEEKQDTITYTYTELSNTNFFTKFHMEDDKSIEIKNKILQIEVDILINEYEYQNLKYYLGLVNPKDSIYEIIFKAIVEKLEDENIQDFIESIEDNIADLYDNLLCIVIDKITKYSSTIVFDFIIKIYSECNLTGKKLEKIESYIENFKY